MGLDQYAYAVLPHGNNTPTSIWWHTEQGAVERKELEANGIAVVSEIAYWRKHPDLQGWMEQLWRLKVSMADPSSTFGWQDFNCTPVQVTFQDLQDLQAAVEAANLPVTNGFFFGQSYPEDKEDDLAFIAKAKEAMAQDMLVYYDSWW